MARSMQSSAEREDLVDDSVWKPFRAVGRLRVELEEDPRIFLVGVDVGKDGNVFGITRDMKKFWPDRLKDAPTPEVDARALGCDRVPVLASETNVREFSPWGVSDTPSIFRHRLLPPNGRRKPKPNGCI